MLSSMSAVGEAIDDTELSINAESLNRLAPQVEEGTNE